MVILTEFRRTTTFALLENTIEITEIVEAAIKTDFGYRMRAINKHSTGITQTLINNILTKISTRVEFEETGSSGR